MRAIGEIDHHGPLLDALGLESNDAAEKVDLFDALPLDALAELLPFGTSASSTEGCQYLPPMDFNDCERSRATLCQYPRSQRHSSR